MRTPYDVNGRNPAVLDYYLKQIGHGLSVFAGDTLQQGQGFGSIAKGAVKVTAPLLQKGLQKLAPALKSSAKDLFSVGIGLAKDAMSGKDVKKTAKSRFKRVGVNALGSLLGNNEDDDDDEDVYAPPPPPKKRKRASNTSAKRTTKKKRKGKSASLFRNVKVVR